MFFDQESGRVLKITKNPPNYGAQGSALDYLTNLENHNLLFFEFEPILFEGILRTDKGDVMVTSQEFVVGRPADQEAVDLFFTERGFRAIGNFSYELEIGSKVVKVFDARPDNVFFDELFEVVVPIDVQILVRSTL